MSKELFVFKSSIFPKKAASSGHDADVSLVTDNGTLVVKKNIIQSASSYFCQIPECEKVRINTTHDVLQLIVKYIETGKIEINRDNLEVCIGQSRLLHELEKFCEIYLHANLTQASCLDFFRLARKNAESHETIYLYFFIPGKYNINSIEKTCAEFIIRAQKHELFNMLTRDEVFFIFESWRKLYFFS